MDDSKGQQALRDRGNLEVPGSLGTGLHKFPGLNETVIAPKRPLCLSPIKTVLHGETTRAGRGDPVDAE